MEIIVQQGRSKPRRAAAALELAILLPLVLAPLVVIAVDWARVFYFAVTLENCARQGALYASGAVLGSTPQQAALADAANLSPQPTVTSGGGTDGNGDPTVSVTATATLQLLTDYPGIGSSVTISRTVTMRIAP